IEHYRRAVALKPDEPDHWRALLATALYLPALDDEARFAMHRDFGRAMASRAAPLPARSDIDRDPQRRLRIGWLSADFRAPSVARNLEALFAHRDRARFQAIAYAEVHEPDPITDWFRGECDLWRSTVGLSDEAVARQIRADGIDVMVYVGGRFDRNRPQ